jgi:hypothetical protein
MKEYPEEFKEILKSRRDRQTDQNRLFINLSMCQSEQSIFVSKMKSYRRNPKKFWKVNETDENQSFGSGPLGTNRVACG